MVPPSVVSEGNSYRIIAGFRRIRCARTLGMRTMPVFVITPGSADTHRLFKYALTTNQHHMSDIDKAYALAKARTAFAFDEQTVTSQLMPLLDLPPSIKVCNEYCRVTTLTKEIQDFVAQGALPFRGAVALTIFSRAEQQLLYRVILRGSFYSASELKQASEWLYGLMRRENISLRKILAQRPFTQIGAKPATPRERGMRILGALRALYYPYSSALNATVDAVRHHLPHRNAVRLEVPASFETDRFVLTISFASIPQLCTILDALKAESKHLEPLFDLNRSLAGERTGNIPPHTCCAKEGRKRKTK